MTLPAPEHLFFVCGPTASGKSARALEIAAELHGEIVNADDFQLYRGLEVLTAAPSREDQEKLPRHLYGVLSPAPPGNLRAGRFCWHPAVQNRRPSPCSGLMNSHPKS